MADRTDTAEWMTAGTATFLGALDTIATDEALSQASQLPGWTRKNLVAHVAANADALCNLAHWAATGEETPMYSSPQQRNADIEAGGDKPASELVDWAHRSASELDQRLAALTDDEWQRPVRTAQGRTVPASEVCWMRSREVWLHTVDLGTGYSFESMPAGFLEQLVGEIVAKRSGQADCPPLHLTADRHSWQVTAEGEPARLSGTLPEVAAYLAGRPNHLTTTEGTPAPELPAWL